ncbi:2TM domain-containing protein [Calothrix rhizosoleniae]|uniref:2TM domain-containing protein n=1 Tax=Calothrix rhizosoleniae TaxID=888997 RepID=UPI000B49EF03|nr:2TM domain-containing protein [Calothrix rhizosoleniae]
MTNFANDGIRSYSQEDVQQILQLAIARQANDTDKEFSYQQLLEIATELNIPLDSLQIAEREWVDQRGEMQKRQEFNSHRVGSFKKRLGKYAIVNTLLLVLDLIGGGGLSWSLYVLIIWGIGVGLDAWNSLQTQGEDYEMAFQKWNRNRQIKSSFNNLVDKFLKATST